MIETSHAHNPNKQPAPNYTLRRLGALVLAGSVVVGGAKIGVETADFVGDRLEQLWGQNVPALKEGDPGTDVITVEHGDTLYGIAKRSAEPDQDVRAVIDMLADQPDAQDGLQPGDKLVVNVPEDQAKG